MKRTRTTWLEKFNREQPPKIETAHGKFAEKFGEGKMVIASPKLVDAIIRRIPKGKLATINMIRAELAKEFGVDYACPITTGIFAWIGAHAAEEMKKAGAKKITPWWRVVKEDGGLNPKYPGGEELHAKRLREEGFSIVQKSLRSKKKVVKNAAEYMPAHF
ncbi:MAG TPA: MGMT family protein [Bacteroidia bacterium]|nr:MGMT family protein [Bacteroidia bacterium]